MTKSTYEEINPAISNNLLSSFLFFLPSPNELEKVVFQKDRRKQEYPNRNYLKNRAVIPKINGKDGAAIAKKAIPKP